MATIASVAAVAMTGCHRGGEAGFELRRLVESRRYAVGSLGGEGLCFLTAPAPGEVEIDNERRAAVLTGPGAWSWRGRVPPGAELHAGVAVTRTALHGVPAVELVVEARRGREREILQVARSSPLAKQLQWLDLAAGLGRYAGQDIELRFAVTIRGLPQRSRGGNFVAWGPVSLAAPRPQAHPNIVLIVVDTLRRDRLTPYGYARDTSPEIAARLARAGTVVEEAYSQAPWTLPSMVSLHTGRYPGELLGADISSYGIPAGVPSLAERMARLGYETGGFIANPAMHAGTGFGRGFETCWVAPLDSDQHADELDRHAVPWLAAHQDRPFFLYAHYLDPHDPYENAETAGNRSPFEASAYTGPVAGTWMQGIYAGVIKLQDPPRDLAHINALYDSEVHYVDRFIGGLLAALTPETLSRTLVVLTADHGEEIFDHHGWKHGHTLYEELIHVPLILRWDGHIPAGRRMPGTVRLLDLLPTLMDAAGGGADPQAEGLDLLPWLTSGKRVPERPAFAIGLAGEPLRAAAVLAKTKLVLFNREEIYRAQNDLQRHLWNLDRERLARIESYDLGRDPGELRNLASGATDPDRPARPAGPPGTAGSAILGQDGTLLEAVIDRRLDRTLPGLRLLAAGIPAGSRLAGRLILERPASACVPYFLGANDSFRQQGNRLDFTFSGEDLKKGLRIEGDVGGLVSLQGALDGRPLSGAALRIGPGTPYPGGSVPAAALRSRGWPEAAPAAGALLFLWRHDEAGEPGRRQAHDSELERRLHALGYL